MGERVEPPWAKMRERWGLEARRGPEGMRRDEGPRWREAMEDVRGVSAAIASSGDMVGSTLHDKRYGLEEEESSKRLGFLFMKVGPDNQKARARWQLGLFQILRNKAKDLWDPFSSGTQIDPLIRHLFLKPASSSDLNGSRQL